MLDVRPLSTVSVPGRATSSTESLEPNTPHISHTNVERVSRQSLSKNLAIDERFSREKKKGKEGIEGARNGARFHGRGCATATSWRVSGARNRRGQRDRSGAPKRQQPRAHGFGRGRSDENERGKEVLTFHDTTRHDPTRRGLVSSRARVTVNRIHAIDLFSSRVAAILRGPRRLATNPTWTAALPTRLLSFRALSLAQLFAPPRAISPFKSALARYEALRGCVVCFSNSGIFFLKR